MCGGAVIADFIPRRNGGSISPSDLWTTSSSLEDSSATRDGRQEEKVGGGKRKRERKNVAYDRKAQRIRGHKAKLNFLHLEVRPQSSWPICLDQTRETGVQLQALQQEETKQRREDKLPVPREVMALDDYTGRSYDGPDSRCQSQSCPIVPPDRDFSIIGELWSFDGNNDSSFLKGFDPRFSRRENLTS